MIIIGQYLPSGQPDMKFSSGDRGLGLRPALEGRRFLSG